MGNRPTSIRVTSSRYNGGGSLHSISEQLYSRCQPSHVTERVGGDARGAGGECPATASTSAGREEVGPDVPGAGRRSSAGSICLDNKLATSQ